MSRLPCPSQGASTTKSQHGGAFQALGRSTFYSVPHFVEPVPYALRKQFRKHNRNVLKASETDISLPSIDPAQLPPYPGPFPETLKLAVGGREWVLETGEIARQANGAVIARDGDTILLSTVCCSEGVGPPSSMLPFTVNYFERFSAAGRTSGAFNKRNPRQGLGEVLTSRLVDRPLRPMFAKGWSRETQVLSWVLSYDGVHATEPLAITSAGTALVLSDIPFAKCVAGVRVGHLPDLGYVVNPTVDQMAISTLDLVIAGTSEAVLMIEGYCDFMTEEQMIEAIAVGHEAISVMCGHIQQWAEQVGKTKKGEGLVLPPQGLDGKVEALVASDIESAYRNIRGKKERLAAVSDLKDRAVDALCVSHADNGMKEELYEEADVRLAFKRVESAVMRGLVLAEGFRADGRRPDEVRPISSRASLLPRTHGSALFTRGETQAVAVTTLGGSETAQRVDEMSGEDDDFQHFYLQYNFPPCSVGEVGRVGGQGRREVGHGRLAERALTPVVPDESSFPYTIRVESTITESNGSSSMATVCGGCLSMMDAGVPIRSMVAGVAMGLVLEPSGQFTILTDILGSEDALGDMDFKVAGNATGITAFQMDIKVEGITLDIMKEALAAAKAGRQHILQEMCKCNPPPRNELSPFAPRIKRLAIDPSKVGLVIGGGGRTIKMLIEKSGCDDITIDQNGIVEILSSKQASIDLATELITELVTDPEINMVYRGAVVFQVQPFGCVVRTRGGRQGLVHVSELDVKYTLNAADAGWKEGDVMDVKVLAMQDNGSLRLSRKQVLIDDAAAAGIVLEVEAPPARARRPRPESSSGEDTEGEEGGSGEGGRPPRRFPRGPRQGGSRPRGPREGSQGSSGGERPAKRQPLQSVAGESAGNKS